MDSYVDFETTSVAQPLVANMMRVEVMAIDLIMVWLLCYQVLIRVLMPNNIETLLSLSAYESGQNSQKK
tara:strand:+ start:25279 stop:25485 length:207 start_codon:yes stop_codon:yes gene_type:complete